MVQRTAKQHRRSAFVLLIVHGNGSLSVVFAYLFLWVRCELSCADVRIAGYNVLKHTFFGVKLGF